MARYKTGGLLNKNDRFEKLYTGKFDLYNSSYFPILLTYKRLLKYSKNINFELYLN